MNENEIEKKKRFDEFIQEQIDTFEARTKAHMEMVNRVTNSTPQERLEYYINNLKLDKEKNNGV